MGVCVIHASAPIPSGKNCKLIIAASYHCIERPVGSRAIKLFALTNSGDTSKNLCNIDKATADKNQAKNKIKYHHTRDLKSKNKIKPDPNNPRTDPFIDNSNNKNQENIKTKNKKIALKMNPPEYDERTKKTTKGKETEIR